MNKAKGHETPKGRSGRDREEDATSNVPEVVDSRPALSVAFTQTWWGPLDKWRVVLVAVPTDRNGPPSMLTSCLAIPEASSEAAHEIVTSDCVTRPLGENEPRVGGLRSTRIDVDFIDSMCPAASMDCQCKVWLPPWTANGPTYVVQAAESRLYRVTTEDPDGLVALIVTFTADMCHPFVLTTPSTATEVVGAPGTPGLPAAATETVCVTVPVRPPASRTSKRME